MIEKSVQLEKSLRTQILVTIIFMARTAHVFDADNHEIVYVIIMSRTRFTVTHVTYAFRYTIYSCLIIKELLARNRRDI